MTLKKLISILISITLALFTISASIAVPILSRGFYAAHVKLLALPQETGWTEAEILEAYDEMMSFELKGTEFGTGVLKWSEAGKAHFTDVRVLFQLDLKVAAISGITLAALLLLSLIWKPHRFGNRGPSFWTGAGVLILFLIIGALGATNFDRAFTVFHSIFFPGKTNWLFDPNLDQIILILPEVFFRNCAILVIALIVILCCAWMVIGRKRKNPTEI